MTAFGYTGSAVQTTLASAIVSTDLTFTLGASTGWPDGSGGKVFVATLGDPENGDTEEKVLCSSLSGVTVTVQQRGYDDTPAQDWSQGTLVRHTMSAKALQEASDHINDGTLHMTDAEHAAITHDQSMLGADSVGNLQLQNDAVGTAEIQDAAVTAAKIPDGGIPAAKLVAAVADYLVPTGTIVAYGGSVAPAGWLMCTGSEESRTTLADLFAVIGTSYGAGNGTTTFNTPNLQQRFPLGKATSGTGATLGETGGEIDHAHSLDTPTAVAQIESLASDTLSPFSRRKSGVAAWNASIEMFGSTGGTAVASSRSGITNGTGLQGDTEALNPPYQVVNYIIKT